MSSEEGDEKRATAVAAVASRLFGTIVGNDAVIDESLQGATEPALNGAKLGTALATAVDADIQELLSDDDLRKHPLAVWIELEIGLEDGHRLTRKLPITIAEAARRLAETTGRPEERCRAQLQTMLTLMSRAASERGGSSDRAFLAFKLHRFVSGAGHAYATLRVPGKRRVSLEGQRFDPRDTEARLYGTYFCRACGQECHPVTLVDDEGTRQMLPRSIDETPIEDTDSEEQAGYLTVIRMLASGRVTVLHTFKGTDGAIPFVGLLEAQDGNLYGTTFLGGENNLGTIFRLNPRSRLEISSLKFNRTVVPPGGTTRGIVTLTSPAPPGGLLVDLSNTNAALVKVPVSVRVPSGATTATFVGKAGQIYIGSVKIWASGPSGAGPAATLRVGP